MGSSSISRRGEPTSACAIPSRCCIPFDMAPTLRAGRVGQADQLEQLARARPRRRPTRPGPGAARAARRRAASRGSGTARRGTRSRRAPPASPAGAPSTSRPAARWRARGRRRSSRAWTCRRRSGRAARPARRAATSRSTPAERHGARRSASRRLAARGRRAPGRSVGSCPGVTDRRGARDVPLEIAESARHVSIDLERLAALDPARRRSSTPSGTTSRGRRRTSRTSARARRDQLRLGLVPDAAEAAGHVGLLHGRVVADRLLARVRRVAGRRAAGIDARGRRRGARPGARATS